MRLLLVVFFALLAIDADAQVTILPNKCAGCYASLTIGTSDTVIVNQYTTTKFLDVWNVSNSAMVCISLGNAAATITGTQCSAGEIPLPPGFHKSFEDNFVPTDAVHAISSASSTPITVGVE